MLIIERSAFTTDYLQIEQFDSIEGLFMATNEVRSEKEGDFTDFASAGEGTLGFDDNTLQGERE